MNTQTLHPFLPLAPPLTRPSQCLLTLPPPDHRLLLTSPIQSTSKKTTSAAINSTYYAVVEDFRIITELKTQHNHIRVVDIPCRITGHTLAGARLLLLDTLGNIHSISFPHLPHPLTSCYFNVFATMSPLLPSSPLAILGFGAGSAARLLYHYYKDLVVHGYKLDEPVITVARHLFHLADLEALQKERLFVNVGDALEAEVAEGFVGILVELFARGSVIPELQDAAMWERIKGKLRIDGRVMVNCGGDCVEAEEEGRGGDEVKEETLKAMVQIFGAGNVFVLNLGGGKEEDDNWMAFTGPLPEDLTSWTYNYSFRRVRKFAVP